MLIKNTFIKLSGKYSANSELLETRWQEIEKQYSGSHRYYHTLLHLENLVAQLESVKDKILDWDATLFAVYYHDIIYNATKSDNEERSAELASKRLKEIAVPLHSISKTVNIILATKKHELNEDSDINYFTDADLSILGQSWNLYEAYFKQVRKEYSIFPDLLHNPGRKKVLEHFLQMPRIFKTDHFYQRYEVQARENLSREKELYR
jgi:predicted metal-dependent HD superfamily phosphohydrolase